jgi:hypothetical protein
MSVWAVHASQYIALEQQSSYDRNALTTAALIPECALLPEEIERQLWPRLWPAAVHGREATLYLIASTQRSPSVLMSSRSRRSCCTMRIVTSH